jgi:NADPH:quinone reductase-like Zn-dependent oxidoreductase
MIEAAAVPLTFVTAWNMLVDRGRITAGDSVLIHAVGSGVGVAGLQIAKLFGARVVALASTQAKLDHARELGADATVLSSASDWPEQVRAIPWVGRRGVDMVFEHVGEATWAQSLRLTRHGGKVLTCGASSGFRADTDLRHVFFRHLEILGTKVGSKSHLFRVLELVEAGRLTPVVDRRFRLAEAASAHTYLDRREQFGKVVLEVVS